MMMLRFVRRMPAKAAFIRDIKDHDREGENQMTDQDRIFLNRINKYAEDVLKDIDPQNTHVSEQLDKLRPIMQELADETGKPLEDVFIKYMDLASEQGVEAENKYREDMGPDVDLELRV